MSQFNEIKYGFRKNAVFLISEILVISITFWLVIVLYIFSKQIATQKGEFNDVYRGKQAFHLTDSLYDDSEFSTYRQSEKNINHVSEFYSLLFKHKDFVFASLFDQQIPVSNFKGDNKFDYGYQTEIGVIGKYTNEEGVFQNVKCMQINQKAYEHYNLSRNSEVNLFNENFNYNTKRLPVILGNAYRGYYKKGDILTVKYYFSTFQFVVIDFLEDNTRIFYNGNINTYLDNYILVPYPNNINSIEDFQFRGILAFAMLNGDIIIDEGKAALPYVLNELKHISEKSGFNHYNILGVPQYVTQYIQVYDVITKNAISIKSLLIVTFIVSITLLCVIRLLIYRSRSNVYYVYYLMGFSMNRLHKLLKYDVLIAPFISVFLFGIIYLKLIFAGRFMSVSFIIGLAGLYYFFYCISKKAIYRYLNAADKKGERG